MNHRKQVAFIGAVGAGLQAGMSLSGMMQQITEAQSEKSRQHIRWQLDKQQLPEVIAANDKQARKAAKRLADQQATLTLQASRRATS